MTKRKDIDQLYRHIMWHMERADADAYCLNFDNATDFDEDLSEDYLLDRIDKFATIETHNFKIFTKYPQYEGEEW
jgi:hypothetical protein